MTSPRGSTQGTLLLDLPGSRGNPPPSSARGPIRSIGRAWPTDRPLLGVLSSVRIPPELVLRTYDIVRALRELEVAVIAGFQSGVERDCLKILLRGMQPVLVCPARSIEEFRIPRAWEGPIREGRLSVLSWLPPQQRRPSARAAAERNDLVVALAGQLLVVHARPGSRAFRAAMAALESGKTVYCPDHERNRDLLLRGAKGLGYQLSSVAVSR